MVLFHPAEAPPFAAEFMATCPKCLGPLTDHHRCPRRIAGRVKQVVSVVGIGGLGGVLVCFAINDRPPGALVLATATLGAVLANAVRQALGRRF